MAIISAYSVSGRRAVRNTYPGRRPKPVFPPCFDAFNDCFSGILKAKNEDHHHSNSRAGPKDTRAGPAIRAQEGRGAALCL